jgi:short-subunit dehydrogenase
MTFAAGYGPWGLVACASGELGAAFAEQLASRGVNVIALGQRQDALEAQADRLRKCHGVQVIPVVADLAEPDIEYLSRDLVERYEIGMFVYNVPDATTAGGPAARFVDAPLHEHITNIAVNCTTPTLMCHHLGSAMAARGRGGILLVNSMGAAQGAAILGSRFAAKAYERILAEGLWAELGQGGVDVLSYVVGTAETPENVAKHALAVLKDGPTVFAMPGAVLEDLVRPF